MAIRTREEILSSVQSVFGENTSDEALALVEDITDTITDLETRNNDSGNWKKKYEECDANWRKKYRDRFFSGNPGDDGDDPDHAPARKNYTFESLFKEG